MALNDLLAELRLDPAFQGRVSAWERLPARPAQTAPWPAELGPELIAALSRRGFPVAYRHQAEAVASALRGEHVVVVTATASGKTLCYNLPVLQRLAAEPQAQALYLFPTKALAQDQRAELEAWNAQLAAPVPVRTYDGDTPRERRAAARVAGGIVLTNPDMLHVGILPHHTRWAALFGRLRFVVLDELHAYRGVFGSHMANVLRRLQRICRFYGSAPQFICTSATIANPREHAERLLEQPVTLIGPERDGAPRGEKHFILLNPPVTDPSLGLRRSVVLEAKDLAARLLQSGVQTIVFARARMTVELLLGYLREAAASGAGPAGSAPHDLPGADAPGADAPGPGTPGAGTPFPGEALAAPAIRGYRGGYLPLERRAIEQGLRAGSVRAVVATNALELGIDIGELDACVLTGYPGTIASTWQQAGRAGRRNAVALVALIASAAPLDQYIASHPRYLFERSPEHALINPDNLAILARHVQCAASELPFEPGEPFGRFTSLDELLDYFVDQGLLVRSAGPPARYVWIADRYAADGVSLRTGGDERVVIQDRSGETVRVIGEMDLSSAPALLHTGAVYWHEGQPFLVSHLDWEARRAEVHAEALDYYTDASESVEIEVLAVHAETGGATGEATGGGPSDGGPGDGGAAQAGHAHGDLLVTSQVSAFRKIKRYSHETLGWGQVELPAQQLQTTGYWLWFPEPLTRELEAEGVLLAPNDYGPEWPAQRDRARARDNYRCRTCGAPERGGRGHDVHHIRPFRDFGRARAAEAHVLDNLVTLCSNCHRRAEAVLGRTSALSGLGNVLGNLSPLFLMCDPRDLNVLVESRARATRLPTITIYERLPGGVGLSQRLYELRGDLLAAATELVAGCRCEQGCPACVGPVGEVGSEAKELTGRLLRRLLP
jgi:DEAD/DEAH box helicase domain-containing protein